MNQHADAVEKYQAKIQAAFSLAWRELYGGSKWRKDMSDDDRPAEVPYSEFLRRSDDAVAPQHETGGHLNELFAAMAKAQGEMSEAIKTSENKFFDSMYADYADIWRVAQKPLADNNLAVMHFPLEDDGKAGCMTWVGHSSGQWMHSTLMLPVPSNSKGERPTTNYVAVVSYAKRINMQSICNIAADEDNDLQGVEQVKIEAKTAEEFSSRLMALGDTKSKQVNLLNRFCKKFGVEKISDLTMAQEEEANKAIQAKETGK